MAKLSTSTDTNLIFMMLTKILPYQQMNKKILLNRAELLNKEPLHGRNSKVEEDSVGIGVLHGVL